QPPAADGSRAGSRPGNRTPPGSETEQAAPGAASARIPRVAIGSVVPGSPADRAGIKPGDWVESIDGKWVVNSKFVDEAREIQLKVTRKELPTSALDELRREIRNRARNSLSPMRAKEKLTRGTSGRLNLVLNRGEDQVKVDVALAKSEMPPIEQTGDGTIRLRLVPGVAGKLSEMIRGKSQVTLDLRGNAVGDYRSMLEILAVVAPTGEYGSLTRSGRNPIPIQVEDGNERAPKLRLLVDKTTRGTAEVFARALQAGGRATVDLSALAGEPFATEIQQLPDGSGYTLAIGRFAAAGEARS
ncbi:MAG: PDZ domain-containing protein, partial [Fimbriimonadaceae bacterium]